MSAPTHEAGQNGPPAGPPPWINDTMQQKIEWRNGDIVVSVPPKSGTTWMMNIVHQLRSGGDPAFADIYHEVPWLEFVPRPIWQTEASVYVRSASLPLPRRGRAGA